MGAIKRRSQVSLDEAKAYARAQGSDCSGVQDFVLNIVLNAIKGKADYVCQNPFYEQDEDTCEYVLDEDGNKIPGEIPPEIELWVMRRFTRDIQYRISGNNKQTVADAGTIDLDSFDWMELSPFIVFR